MLGDKMLQELMQIANAVTQENIGDSLLQGFAIRASNLNPYIESQIDEILGAMKDFSRNADISWGIFANPLLPAKKLDQMQVMQLQGIVITLMELNYCFESVERSVTLTFENSAPTRFYVNGIFHYLTALFLLDTKKNRMNGLPYPGTVVKVLHPLGISKLLVPVYQVFDRPFGQEKTYGETVLAVRNRQFVHGSFSPENIRSLVKDSNIFSPSQKVKLVKNHLDVGDKLIVLRLQLLAILSHMNLKSASNLFPF